ncbi:nucleotidyltransferase domain-containing protein [Microbacter sp. GSS18]|nr:nucleotidyltransferase domain-containing protein [Microbacter sp. GSS18]
MELQHPLAVVTPGVDGQVLYALASTDSGFTVPQLVTVIEDRSAAGIRRSLERLTDQGIVIRQVIGRTQLFSLNDDHLAAGAVRELAALRSQFLARLRATVADWPHPPVYAAIYGSAARGDMRWDSDIDLLLIRPDDAGDEEWTARLAELTSAVTRWTGNDARIVDMDADEASARHDTAFVHNIVRDAVVFAGRDDWLERAGQGA